MFNPNNWYQFKLSYDNESKYIVKTNKIHKYNFTISKCYNCDVFYYDYNKGFVYYDYNKGFVYYEEDELEWRSVHNNFIKSCYFYNKDIDLYSIISLNEKQLYNIVGEAIIKNIL